MMDRWSLVGLGYISPRHKDAIEHVGDHVYMTCDNDPKKKADFLDFEEMIKSQEFKRVQNVSILTPNYLHVSMANKCAELGKKVICEKPLTLNSADLDKLNDNVFTVLQLRYLSIIEDLKKVAGDAMNAELVVKVKRDASYWKSWKGNEEKSGGILFNLGVHYFDLLIQLFGESYAILEKKCLPRLAQGTLNFWGTKVRYKIKITESPGERYIRIDGKKYLLSTKDNLSEENLHRKIYEEFKKGRGVQAKELKSLTQLIEKLK